ncbi:hypothetical protein [Streptomyces fagopyri]|uniref:hypothetical protein n=1 Tax=Streptomyces fagopyri TaxID=2662397 RepID=UPI00382BFB44
MGTPQTEDENARPAAVYRLYDDAGTLLYIGSAYDPETRAAQHKDKPWWPDIARRTDEWHPSRHVAYTEETKAIAADKPLHNTAGTPKFAEDRQRRAREDPRRQAIIRAGSAAGRGAPREIVDAILRGEIKSYTKNGPIPFD